jgi:hypothetical protein
MYIYSLRNGSNYLLSISAYLGMIRMAIKYFLYDYLNIIVSKGHATDPVSKSSATSVALQS